MVTTVLSGRNSAATTATAISRDAMPASPAGRPAARCGSAPSTMPPATTAMTWSAGCLAGLPPTISTTA